MHFHRILFHTVFILGCTYATRVHSAATNESAAPRPRNAITPFYLNNKTGSSIEFSRPSINQKVVVLPGEKKRISPDEGEPGVDTFFLKLTSITGKKAPPIQALAQYYAPTEYSTVRTLPIKRTEEIYESATDEMLEPVIPGTERRAYDIIVQPKSRLDPKALLGWYVFLRRAW